MTAKTAYVQPVQLLLIRFLAPVKSPQRDGLVDLVSLSRDRY